MGTAALKIEASNVQRGKKCYWGVFAVDLFSRGNFYFFVRLSSEQEMDLHFSKANNNA